MSFYSTPVINERNKALRLKQGQTKFVYLVDSRGKCVKFLGWKQGDVWN